MTTSVATHVTYATLCIYAPSLEVRDSVAGVLALESTRQTARDGIFGWFRTTKDAVSSPALDTHLAFLIDILRGREQQVSELKSLGCKLRILCFWSAEETNSGFELSPDTLLMIGRLGLELHFDIWAAN